MITVSILWAIGSTVLGIAAAVGWVRAESRLRWIRYGIEHWKHRALTAEDALSVIRFKRHRSASHARNCQVQQQRALVRQVTEKMRAEIGR